MGKHNKAWRKQKKKEYLKMKKREPFILALRRIIGAVIVICGMVLFFASIMIEIFPGRKYQFFTMVGGAGLFILGIYVFLPGGFANVYRRKPDGTLTDELWDWDSEISPPF